MIDIKKLLTPLRLLITLSLYFMRKEKKLCLRNSRAKDGHIVPTGDEKQISAFTKLLSKLIEAKPQPINSARILAETLAAKAKVIAAILSIALSKAGTNQTKEDKDLHIKLDAFKKFLVHDMTEEQFADFYAQTIVMVCSLQEYTTSHHQRFRYRRHPNSYQALILS